MNISCVICQDLFAPSAEIVTVVCGHLFHSACIFEWIERSKSCPQCRHKISSKTTHRVYFNISKIEDENVDIATLQNKLDSYSFEIRLKKKELSTAQDKNSSLETANMGLRKLVSELEGKIRKLESTLLALKDQMKYLKEQYNHLQDVNKQIEKLQEEVEFLRKTKQIMLSPNDDISQVLHGYQDSKGLATMVVLLKRELVEQNHKREKLRKRLAITEAELKEITNKLNILNSQNKKSLNTNEDYESLEQENIQLKNKLQELEKNNLKDVNNLDNQLNSSTSRINKAGVIQRKYTLRKSHLKSTESPSVEEKVKSITNSNSPYLQIKSSIIGVDSHQLKSGSSNSDKCLIFRKKCPINTNLTVPKPNTYTGMGGFAGIEMFLSRKSSNLSTKRPNSASSLIKPKTRKIIKLDPSLQKMDDFIDIVNE